MNRVDPLRFVSSFHCCTLLRTNSFCGKFLAVLATALIFCLDTGKSSGSRTPSKWSGEIYAARAAKNIWQIWRCFQVYLDLIFETPFVQPGMYWIQNFIAVPCDAQIGEFFSLERRMLSLAVEWRMPLFILTFVECTIRNGECFEFYLHVLVLEILYEWIKLLGWLRKWFPSSCRILSSVGVLLCFFQFQANPAGGVLRIEILMQR